MTSKADRKILAEEECVRRFDAVFNEAKDTLCDEGVWSADQIYALRVMLDLMREAILCRPNR